MNLLSPVLTGFGLSLGLILAIGPQNVFVLRQGLQKSHVFAVCLTCSICDGLFILAGVAGVGAALQQAAWIERPLALGAAAFIAGYGVLRLFSARNPSAMVLDNEASPDLGATILAALGFTFLNPHVYLDTLLLLGGHRRPSTTHHWWRLPSAPSRPRSCFSFPLATVQNGVLCG